MHYEKEISKQKHTNFQRNNYVRKQMIATKYFCHKKCRIRILMVQLKGQNQTRKIKKKRKRTGCNTTNRTACNNTKFFKKKMKKQKN